MTFTPPGTVNENASVSTGVPPFAGPTLQSVPLLVGLDYAARWGNASTTRPSTTLSARPFLIGRACTVDRLSVRVTVAGDAAAVVRLGLYHDNENGAASLLVDAGTVPGNAVATQSVLLTPPVAVPAGWLLPAVVCVYPTTAPTVCGWTPGGVNADGPMPQGFGFFNGWSVTAVGGALPVSIALNAATESDTCLMATFRIAS